MPSAEQVTLPRSKQRGGKLVSHWHSGGAVFHLATWQGLFCTPCYDLAHVLSWTSCRDGSSALLQLCPFHSSEVPHGVLLPLRDVTEKYTECLNCKNWNSEKCKAINPPQNPCFRPVYLSVHATFWSSSGCSFLSEFSYPVVAPLMSWAIQNI